MAFRSDMEAVLLSVLETGPIHGYAIVKILRDKSNGVIRVGEGQLYPALKGLEARGLVTSSWAEQSGKPARKVYSLTSEGHGRLAGQRQRWTEFRQCIDSVLLID